MTAASTLEVTKHSFEWHFMGPIGPESQHLIVSVVVCYCVGLKSAKGRL
jgi:hypothetical protein